MKKKLLIGLTSFYLAITMVVAFFVIQYWSVIKAALPLISYSNIKSLYIAAVMDETEQADRLKEIDDTLSKEITDYIDMEIRDFTEEELKQIESGEKTKTEIIAQIITESTTPVEETPSDVSPENTGGNEQTTPQNPENVTPANPQKPVETPKGETADEIVARHISNLYALHGEFEGRINALASTARNWMHAYKKTNNVSWHDAKVATMNNFMSQASQIETECYAKVDAEIAALESDLKAIGADTSVVATVRSAAYNEMEVRKGKIVSEGTAKLNS